MYRLFKSYARSLIDTRGAHPTTTLCKSLAEASCQSLAVSGRAPINRAISIGPLLTELY